MSTILTPVNVTRHKKEGTVRPNVRFIKIITLKWNYTKEL